jgi:hypothetical protein
MVDLKLVPLFIVNLILKLLDPHPNLPASFPLSPLNFLPEPLDLPDCLGVLLEYPLLGLHDDLHKIAEPDLGQGVFPALPPQLIKDKLIKSRISVELVKIPFE